MASNPPQDCCTQGFKLEGDAAGTFGKIGSIETYFTGDKSSKKVLLLLTDILGIHFPNSQLVADKYAEQGYYVVVPDIFYGEAREFGAGFLEEWIPRHGPAQTDPIVDEVVKYIKDELKPTQLSSIGYCFGARYTVRLLGKKAIDVGAIAHPSFVQLEEVAEFKNPLIIIAAEEDGMFTPEGREATLAKLKEIKATYFITMLSGTSHGFAVRGNTKEPWPKLAISKAFSDSAWWFKSFE